jgi:hypothetical protein
MLVELGNTLPDTGEPDVINVSVPDIYTYVVADGTNDMELGAGNVATPETAAELATHVMRDISVGDPDLTHSPDQEALISVVRTWAAYNRSGSPTWVWSDDDNFAVLLGCYFASPVGRPDDVEETHHTASGPPGVGPAAAEIDPTSSEEN